MQAFSIQTHSFLQINIQPSFLSLLASLLCREEERMGVCCSKKKEEPFVPSNDLNAEKQRKKKKKKKKKDKIKVVDKKEVEVEATPPMDKKPVFVLARNTKQTSTTDPTTKPEDKLKKDETELDVKNHAAGSTASVVVPEAEQAPTLCCAKQESEEILLRRGRLGGGGYSGRKRSYDFDNEMSSRDNEEHQDQKQLQPSKPSPHRRTPSRESGSQQRVGRSPVRRLESPAASSSSHSSNCDRSRPPPTKMLLVPAREKITRNAAATAIEAKKVTNVVPNRRNVAPRPKSPIKGTRISNEKAQAHYPTQSRSLTKISPKKAEQSPCRRNPMIEIDGNSINRVHKSKEGESVRKATQNEPQKKNNRTNGITRGSNGVREQLPSCRTKKQLEPEIHEDASEPKGTRSSGDFDNNHVDAATYTSLLLEDINNYHQRNASISLPACVYKARSILEAVADLNSSSSDPAKHDNGQFGKKVLTTQKDSFVESEVAVKDDIMEPTLHKYITVRNLPREMEPQESAGSNSFISQPWTCSPELNNSVDSTDQHLASHFNSHEEQKDIEESSVRDFDVWCGGSNSNSILSSTMLSSTKKNKQLHCGVSGGNVKYHSRAYSSNVATAN